MKVVVKKLCHADRQYLPLQDAYGGPNYFDLDPQAFMKFAIDNNGDAKRI